MIAYPLDIKSGDHMYFTWNTVDGHVGSKKQQSKGYEVIVKSIGTDHICIHSVMGDYDMYFTKELMDSLDATCKKV